MLSKAAQNLWGKKDIDKDGKELWLPLIIHMIDTKNVIRFLYYQFLNQGQHNIILKSFENEEQAVSLIQFLGFIHDIGKATPAFQTKPSYGHSKDLDQEIVEKLLQSGFSDLDYHGMADPYSHARAGEVILEENGLNKSLGAIIGGHHGIPQEEDFDYIDEFNEYEKNYDQYNDLNISEEKNLWLSVQRELIEYGLKCCKLSKLEDLPAVDQTQAVILNGLVIMADWLASSFPLINLDEGFAAFTDENLKKRFEVGISNWKSNTDKWENYNFYDTDELYKKRFGFKPRDIQKKIAQEIQNTADPGMIIIEAPMGIGKTEIALSAVEEIATKTGRNELFFGLPTQATANAMFKRVEDWLDKVARDKGDNLQIKLMHGKAQFNEDYQKIPNAANVEENGSVVINSWFSGKKSILSDFTIGTIDQLLLMGLKRKHFSLGHLGLSGKIVIIDEVHAYDTYMSSYLEKALEWLGAYHVPVIALSATLPSKKRNQLLEAYNEGKYQNQAFKANDSWESNHAYPLLSILDGHVLKQFEDFDRTSLKQTTITLKKINPSDKELVNSIYLKIDDGGIAGVIVNTVKRAQLLSKLAQKNLPQDIEIMTLHSAFLATDREKLEKKLQSKIGKNGKRPNKMIVIGTQVLEQSLDIDFDILFTDIAPIDLILQRAGRLHRHNIDRPKKLIKSELYVMGIEDFGQYGDANEAIYSKYLLMKTDYVLKHKVVLPDDISPLVKEVYSEDINAKIDGLKTPFSKFQKNQKNSEALAQNFQICSPNAYSTIHGFLDAMQQDVDINENRAQAAVRDIQESIEVVLLQHTDQGDFLVNEDRTNIEELSEADRDKIIARQVIRLPHALTFEIENSIKKLESLTEKYYHSLCQNSNWLKGSLIFPLDKNLVAEFNGYQVKYSSKLGLSYEKE